MTKIQNVVFNGGNTLDTIGREMAITSTYSTASPIGYLEISGCTFNNFMYSMYFNRLSNAVIENCQFNGTKYNAINIAADGTAENSGSDNIVISNNVFQNISAANCEYDEYSSGIRLGVNTSNITLLNNTIGMLNNKLPIYVDKGNTQVVATVKNGDTVLEQYLLAANGTITLPAALEKDDSTFYGWSDGTNTYNAGSEVTITKDTTFNPQWLVISDGGSSNGGNTTTEPDNTETVTNPDGSTTTTVTGEDGTKTETTKTEDGATSVVTTDKDGKVEAEVKLPAAVVNEAAEAGEAVALPMSEVTATTDSETAPTVTVDLPTDTTAMVEIPVADVTAGTVAVRMLPDGTEEIIKTTLTTENGVAVTLSDGDTVKIVDNSKDFADVPATHWGR